MSIITGYAEVSAVLEDPAFVVPPASPPAPTGVAWLRAHVARFSEGAAHARRRALAVAELDRIDPAALHTAALARAAALSAHPGLVAEVVPVAVLAESMGLVGDVVAEVAAVAKVYLTGGAGADPAVSRAAGPAVSPAVSPAVGPAAGQGRDPGAESGGDPFVDAADRAVEALVERFGGIADELTAARIGLLVQAFAATGGLIRATVERGTSVEQTERDASPVPGTRRVEPSGGAVVFLDFAAANAEAGERAPLTFGLGRHRCPGRAHAMAIADGAVEGVGR
jgi:cytochrome P450